MGASSSCSKCKCDALLRRDEERVTVYLVSGVPVSADLQGAENIGEVRLRVAVALQCSPSSVTLVDDGECGRALTDDVKLENLPSTSIVAVTEDLDKCLSELPITPLQDDHSKQSKEQENA